MNPEVEPPENDITAGSFKKYGLFIDMLPFVFTYHFLLQYPFRPILNHFLAIVSNCTVIMDGLPCGAQFDNEPIDYLIG
jgi:hypothetical protein